MSELCRTCVHADYCYDEPQNDGCDHYKRNICEDCEFRKFSENVADKLAEVMVANGIKDFDELAKICGLNDIGGDNENNN